MDRPIFCVDFDGVIHSYVTAWKSAEVISDPPVNGAMKFLWDLGKFFEIHIVSHRSSKIGGREAMKDWLKQHFTQFMVENGDEFMAQPFLDAIHWPIAKPAAFLTLDDRAITFTGEWPTIEQLRSFRPWSMKER